MTPAVTYQQAKASLAKVRPALRACLTDDDIYSIGIVRDGEGWAYRAEVRLQARVKMDADTLRIDGIPLDVEYVEGAHAVAARSG